MSNMIEQYERSSFFVIEYKTCKDLVPYLNPNKSELTSKPADSCRILINGHGIRSNSKSNIIGGNKSKEGFLGSLENEAYKSRCCQSEINGRQHLRWQIGVAILYHGRIQN